MYKNAHMRYQTLMEQIEADEEYQELEQLRQQKLPVFRAVIRTLTQEQQDAVMDYMGISEEQYFRAVELMCFIRQGN